MLYGLIAVGVVAHIHQLHLADLVDDEAVVALVEEGRQGEDTIQARREARSTAHQLHEPWDVVED